MPSWQMGRVTIPCIAEMDLAVPARRIPQAMPSELYKSTSLLHGTRHSCQTTESSHLPFLSQPSTLSRMLIDPVVQSLVEQRAELLDT